MTLLLALAACNETPQYIPPKDSDTGTVDTGPWDTGTKDTSDTDGDQDDDGFTPEDGDCDDADIMVSPARDEEPGDGKDNDCDGRIDEEWSGVTTLYVTADGASSSLYVLDTIGRVSDQIDIKDAVGLYLDNDPTTGGWVINDLYADVGLVDTSGTYTMLGDFSDTDAWPNGVYGVVEGADGTIYATTGDKLVTVGRDGTLTEVATWGADFEDLDNWDLFGYGLAYDPLTGDVAVFDGVTDGFGTYNPATGFTVLRRGATDGSQSVYLWAGAHMDGVLDGSGWYAPGVDATTGSYGILHWDGAGWTETKTWTDEDWSMFMLATDSDVGDFYVTAYGGWYPSVWRFAANVSEADDFYVEEADQQAYFYGIVSNY